MKRVSSRLLGQRAHAWWGYGLLRLGPWGALGVVALVLALVLGIAAQLLHGDAEALSQRLPGLRAQLERGVPTGPVAPQGVAAFLAQFPGEDSAPEFIESLHREALTAGLQIERAEYRAPAVAAGKLIRLEVTLPLAGRYPAVNRWLSVVLHDHPSAAIDQISLQRDAAGGSGVRARVLISHYSRGAP